VGKPENSTVIGIVCLAAVAYVASAVLHPAWPMAYGQLLGFIAYAAVLADPYIGLFRDELADESAASVQAYGSYAMYGGEGVDLRSLAIFSTVLVLGTALGIWAMVLDRRTRIIGRSSGISAPVA
jgi:hypothetical protein